MMRAYAVAQVAGWTLYGLSGVATSVAFGNRSPAALATMVAGAAMGGAVSHRLRAEIRRRRWLDLPVGALLPRLLAGAVVAGLASELGVWAVGLFVTRA
jgi:hypothetical protein